MIHDEFAYLLAADTFSHGRLTNPTHPLWRFFETIYVISQPTYSSKYPPAQGLAMALGQVLFGHPWFGVWLSCGLLAACLCWAFFQWLPARWALLASALSLHLCFFSYWMNSYWGGAVAATGGALLLGSWRQLTRPPVSRGRNAAWLFGAGAVIVICARPFEGGLLVLALSAALAPYAAGRRGLWLPFALTFGLGLAWLGYYQYRVTGNPVRMPYQAYQHRYESYPQFNLLPSDTSPRDYGHQDLEWADKGWLREAYLASRSAAFPLRRAQDWYKTLLTWFGNPLPILPLVLLLPWHFRFRRTRLPATLAALIVAATFIVIAHFSHYPAPFLAVFIILAVQGLRLAARRGLKIPVALFAAVTLAWTLGKDARLIIHRLTPDRFRSLVAHRPEREAELARVSPGKHVVFVRYTQYKSPHEEWIYNSADIEGQAVVWAQDMGPEENRKLQSYFPDRRFWRIEPDESSETLIPYP